MNDYPRTGDPVLSEAVHPTSIVTRVGTFSLYSHCEILYIPERMERMPDKWEVISAEYPKVKRMPFSKYERPDKAHIFRVDCNDQAAYRAYARAADMARRKVRYDSKGLLWVGALKLIRLGGILKLNPFVVLGSAIATRLPNPLRNKAQSYCGSNVQKVYKPEIGRFCKGVNPDNITPEDIARSKKTREIARYQSGILNLV